MPYKHGFALVELFIVIIIITILAAIVIPRYLNFTYEAKRASEEAVVGSVCTGIQLWHMAYATGAKIAPQPSSGYPRTLDAAPENTDASPTNPLFTEVLEKPITEGWKKVRPWWPVILVMKLYPSYYYVGPTESVYEYDSEKGTFRKFEVPGQKTLLIR